MNRTEVIKEFFVKKAKQIILKIEVKRYEQIGYTGDEIGKLEAYVKAQGKLEAFIEKEFKPFLVEHEELQLMNLNELSKLPQYQVSIEKQKEITKELLGREVTISQLIEELDI